MNFLASIGSVSPFVGLFGTVWGIMNSFTSIADPKIQVWRWWRRGLQKPCLLQHSGCWQQYLQWLPIINFQEIWIKLALLWMFFAQEFTTLLGRQLDEGGR